MPLRKNIAQDPGEGPGQTKDCPVCNGPNPNGPQPGMLWGVNPKENPPFQCGNCSGTGKVHK
ncbi:hypothetical protein [Amycolatopsis eburnea]|uniref:Uncharacterized protein n=1 Tax=Amycolatopsis eburnea TaxID=2267691 RepID=A0A427TPX7_9PSEU|nr:hypothetical protein [Amycolatopsis eburnea]RSD26368.1 hypothetical protein EIY87_00455 [Amycolatopsis eburnea]